MSAALATRLVLRHQVSWHRLQPKVFPLPCKRTFYYRGSLTAKPLLQYASSMQRSHQLKVVFCGSGSVQLRILACFATKASSSPTNQQTEQPARESIWKSSRKSAQPGEASADGRTYREKLYRQISLDTDLSKVVTEEMVLYQLQSTTLYRVFFVLVVAQFIFWAVCANILFMFYSGVDSEGNKLRDLTSSKKEEVGSDASFAKTWLENISANGYQFLVQGFFMMIGTFSGVVMMFLLKRCVSFIHLMPGAKQVKIGHLNVFGGVSPTRFKIFNLEDLSSVEHRLQRVNYISLRVRGLTSSYLIDKYGGRFSNETIYDQTIGVQRNIKSPK